ncbi:MAG: phosphopyruvate hydratase [Candidatus Kerfeldbacteria bacterium RIFOXYB2_FULL_38_14]|uniref:Enolase n=1 Tax=Candidatus Kerfeldbacteria bacterium RIFOXYB2_FULL_38_14 TaxID=1798547 RepID=A0A1G2BBA3_9BACT|nr:MAG: phosphopyruvate hydratase [Candidatus Kerfeldbacteria bacterium RIFOXYB2_FULL_38_14]
MKLKSLQAREILDSRGNPTVAVKAVLENNVWAEAMVPSGASTGTHEALELRDGDKKRYAGLGVLKACENVNNKIQNVLKNFDISSQAAVDEQMIKLDGTENKTNLGANSILGVSLAIAQAQAKAQNLELYAYLRQNFVLDLTDYRLPYTMMNVLNGGKHSNNGLNIQEFMIIPQASEFAERIRLGAEVFQSLKKILNEKGHSTAVGDEGGFAPSLSTNEEALQLLQIAIEKAGYVLGQDVCLGIDAAASEFFNKEDNSYTFDKQKISAEKLMDIYQQWTEKYHIMIIEDGLAEDDWKNWAVLTKRLGAKIVLIGDDLFVTNTKRLQKGIEQKVANAILIKVNQIGTLSETMAAINLARAHHYQVIISHRSGETEDTTIADLAVAVNADYIKTGSLSRSERIAKYNRLLAIDRNFK